MCRHPVRRPPSLVAALGTNNVVHGPRHRRAPVRPRPAMSWHLAALPHPAPCPVFCRATTFSRATLPPHVTSSPSPHAAQATWPSSGASRPAVRPSPPCLTGAAVAARELSALAPRPQPPPPPPPSSASYASYVGPLLAAASAHRHVLARAARPPHAFLVAPRRVSSQVTFGELYLAPPVDPELALAARRAGAGRERAARDFRGSLPSLCSRRRRPCSPPSTAPARYHVRLPCPHASLLPPSPSLRCMAKFHSRASRPSYGG